MMFQIQTYLLPGLAASIVFLFFLEIGVRIRNERITWLHRAVVLLTGLYLTAAFSMTVSQGSAFTLPRSGADINLIPFRAWDTAFSNPMNFWGNILLFVPLGIFLVLLFNQCQKLFVTAPIGMGISAVIELLQLFGVRSTDIDDVILNTVGTLLGYFIGRMIISFAPFLRKGIGVYRKEERKLTRKQNDAGSFAVLTAFVLASVLLTGYIPINAAPAMSQGDALASEQAPEISNTGKISIEIDAENAYLWDISTSTVLFEKNSEERIAPASTAKMLNALTALEYCGEDEKAEVGREVQLIAKDASRAWLTPGSELTIRQLFDALLLPSGNDAAYAIAAFAGKKISRDNNLSVEEAISAFMKAMNQKAADIGAVHSHFIAPDGYDADGQYTTAQDLAIIAQEFLKSDILKEIAGSRRISDIWLSGQDVTYYNTNELINPESPYYYECAAGLKTGKSQDAGSCLVSCANINDKTYVCVVMGSTEDGRWRDSIKLYQSIPR